MTKAPTITLPDAILAAAASLPFQYGRFFNKVNIASLIKCHLHSVADGRERRTKRRARRASLEAKTVADPPGEKSVEPKAGSSRESSMSAHNEDSSLLPETKSGQATAGPTSIQAR